MRAIRKVVFAVIALCAIGRAPYAGESVEIKDLNDSSGLQITESNENDGEAESQPEQSNVETLIDGEINNETTEEISEAINTDQVSTNQTVQSNSSGTKEVVNRVASNSKKVTSTKQDEVNTSSNQSVGQSNEAVSKPTTNNNQTKVEKPAVNTPIVEEKVPEVKNYQIGNSGKLFATEGEAYTEAERMFDNFEDSTKYVSSYVVYSTYDKWTITYYYANY